MMRLMTEGVTTPRDGDRRGVRRRPIRLGVMLLVRRVPSVEAVSSPLLRSGLVSFVVQAALSSAAMRGGVIFFAIIFLVERIGDTPAPLGVMGDTTALLGGLRLGVAGGGQTFASLPKGEESGPASEEE